MSRRGDRRPAVAAPLGQARRLHGAALLAAVAGFPLATGVPLAPRRLLGWVAAAGALLARGAPAPPAAVRVRAAAPPAAPTRWGTSARPPG